MHRMVHEVHCRATPGNKLPGTHLWVKRETATAKCIAQQHKKNISTAQLNCTYCMFTMYQKDSMLPFVCPVTQDHRWRQNVVRTKKWHMRRQQSVSLMFLQHFDALCDLLLNKHMATWNRFVLYYKETNYDTKSFFYT